VAGRNDHRCVFGQYGTVKIKVTPNVPMQAQRGRRSTDLPVLSLGIRGEGGWGPVWMALESFAPIGV
jgi:hypothetical protein